MTEDRKPETPGMSEVSPKFVHEAEAVVEGAALTDEALSALWQECERLRQQYGEAVKETDLVFTARQAITETETPEYRAAVITHETADQHQQETSDTMVAAENRMAKVPANTVSGVLFKLRVVGVEVADEFKGHDGVLDETLLGSVERLTLSALADLERMSGETAGVTTQARVAPGATSPLRSHIFVVETPITDAEGAVAALWLLVQDGKLCPDAAEPIAYLVSHLNEHISEQRRLFNELFTAAGGTA